MQNQFPQAPTSSQTITVDATQEQPLDSGTDPDAQEGTIFLSSASIKDLHSARRKMQQYQREYWMDFAQQRGMSFTSEPGPSDREPEPPDDDEPPMRWDSVMMPERSTKRQGISRRANQNMARVQRVPLAQNVRAAANVAMPQIPQVPMPRIPPSSQDDENHTDTIQLPDVPRGNIPRWDRGNVPHRERLRAYGTRFERDMLSSMDKRLGT
mmetsp:Transcript_9749/g.36296  ORF Transcript_9749/g.36296 Transcript_9749/m.36296 type:complete len:211 (+) Transcript_9749:102-734(+)